MVSESHDIKASANVQFGKSDFSQAISTYERALSSLPNYLDYEIAVLQSNIAACHLKLQEWKQAIDAADEAITALDREDPPPPEEKSKPKSKTKKPGEAEKSSTRGRKSKIDGFTSDSSDADDYLDSQTTATDPVPSTAGPPPAVVELPSSDSETEEKDDTHAANATSNSTTTALKNLAISDQRYQDISRIRTKALLRRARARMELGRQLSREGKGMFSSNNKRDTPSTPAPILGDPSQPNPPPKPKPDDTPSSPWTLLSAAQADYLTLLPPTSASSANPLAPASSRYTPYLPASDLRSIRLALTQLPFEIETAKTSETAEMMGKLKELGNGLLKPFGLSTDMFQFVKDEKTGGYSMNFDQGGGGKK